MTHTIRSYELTFHPAPQGVTVSRERYTLRFPVCHGSPSDVFAASSGFVHLYTLRVKEKERPCSAACTKGYDKWADLEILVAASGSGGGEGGGEYVVLLQHFLNSPGGTRTKYKDSFKTKYSVKVETSVRAMPSHRKTSCS